MEAQEDTPRVQILSVSDTGRRCRWTDDEKIRIVDESRRDGVTLADVARRHEILRSMLYDWRYRHKLGLLGAPADFMRLVPMDGGPRPDLMPPPPAPQPPAVTIDLGERYRVKLLAMVLFEEFGQHQPLNRQTERSAKEGIEISLSTMDDQVGACAIALQPIHGLIRTHVLGAERLHADDTTVPLLAKGGTQTARLWTYLRNDRPFAGGAPAAALYCSLPTAGWNIRAAAAVVAVS